MATSNFSILGSARVYVGTYGKYNSGSLAGAWLTLSDYSDYNDFLSACCDLHSDEDDPEFMIQDSENLPRVFLTGYLSESVNPEFWDMLQTLSELSENEAEAVLAYWDECDSGASIDSIIDRYQGYYDSEEDYAEQLYAECYDIPDHLYNYIDWSAVARDIFIDYSFCSGHVFSC